MNRSALVFAAIAITTGVAAGWLWMQLRDERAAHAQLRATTQASLAPRSADVELPEVHVVAPRSGNRRQ